MSQLSLLDEDPPLDLSGLPENLWVGTSSFSTGDWVGNFYPAGTKPGEYLAQYASVLRTVEIDATWHAVPQARTFEGWASKVPEGFRFALKVPKSITHDKALVGCETEWGHFWELTELLGDKRGPLLFQFPYVAQKVDAEEHRTGQRFLDRFAAFTEHLPAEGEFAVEVRNRGWIAPPLVNLLRERGMVLALTAYYTMPHPQSLLDAGDPLTGDFGYVRFLGHHRRMDQLVAEAKRTRGKKRAWDEALVDRRDETKSWVPVLRHVLERTKRTYVYYNNHYAGHAPSSIALLNEIWKER